MLSGTVAVEPNGGSWSPARWSERPYRAPARQRGGHDPARPRARRRGRAHRGRRRDFARGGRAQGGEAGAVTERTQAVAGARSVSAFARKEVISKGARALRCAMAWPDGAEQPRAWLPRPRPRSVQAVTASRLTLRRATSRGRPPPPTPDRHTSLPGRAAPPGDLPDHRPGDGSPRLRLGPRDRGRCGCPPSDRRRPHPKKNPGTFCVPLVCQPSRKHNVGEQDSRAGSRKPIQHRANRH